MIPYNIFSSAPIPNGHSWTITSRAGHILQSAEEKYGKRNPDFTLLGIEFTSDSHPRTWFPGNCGNIIIQITENCISDMDRAVFQVAHEIVHFLCPKVFGKATYLEEGLATYFSMLYMQENNFRFFYPGDKKYELASSLVEQLLSFDEQIIKKLRMNQPDISMISNQMIHEYNPNIPLELITKLTTNFQNTI